MAKIRMTKAQSDTLDLILAGVRDPRLSISKDDLLMIQVSEYSLDKATKHINVSRTVLRDGHSGDNGRMDYRTEIWRIDLEGNIRRL